MTQGTAVAIVDNMPEYAMKRRYIVARYDSGRLWFYGAWDDLERCSEVVDTLDNGIILIPQDFTGDNK